MAKRKNERGFGDLVSLAVCCVIFLILTAMAIPNLTKLAQVAEQRNVVVALRQIAAAETYYHQIYGNGYAPPPTLSGNGVAVTIKTCDNPFMLIGHYAQTQIGHYRLSWTGVGTAPLGTGCTAQGYLNFMIVAAPDAFAGNRSYYIDGSGVLRYSDSITASSSSPAWIY